MAEARGYIEGYYGKLLTWDERARLLKQMQRLGMTGYLYAPKEDALHRWQWRTPYNSDWTSRFAAFAKAAAAAQIELVAGVAPGLDFDFASLGPDASQSGDTAGGDAVGGDLGLLLAKARHLLAAGATGIALLIDDIDADFTTRCGAFTSEGVAHATLANRLAAAVPVPVMLVPRIYADSLIQPDDPQSIGYLADVTAVLAPSVRLVYCGDDIVAHRPGGDAAGLVNPREVMVWDNFYANDYCPRRLFVGPWRGRGHHQSLWLNPTGMIETDLLLLAIMQESRDADSDAARHAAWDRVMAAHDVPDAFRVVAGFFDAPYGFEPAFTLPDTAAALAALDQLLWRWKSPLQREWYPLLMGLKHDLAIGDATLPLIRLQKTQLAPLATRLDDASR